ncbi:MAG: DUF4838 domain-containing protein [Lentisphaerae bacterium]|nr:DUF4838 domain-containing protein [Lentisphaerota bacterium]
MKNFLLLTGVLFSTVLAAAVPEFLVTGEQPVKLENMAEKELCLFYKQIYGKELKKIGENEADGKSVIFLGNTDFARKNGVDPDAAGKEEWILKTVGDDLIISGGRPAGTLYGVYELLERLGTAFLTPDETVIPTGKPDFPKFDEKKKPAFPGRLIYNSIPGGMLLTKADPAVLEAYRLWALRSRINGRQKTTEPYYYLGDYYNLSTYPYHNLGWYVDPNKYFKTHPEYFQMDPMGRRIRPKSKAVEGSLCMSNPEVKRITLETLRGFIQRDRKAKPKDEWPVVYDISELDATSYICRCPECKKIIEADGSESGLLLQYINHIAREIRKEYPDIIIRTSARGRMPGKMLPEKNVLMRIGTKFTVVSPFAPIDLDRYPDYKPFFNAWTKLMPQLQMWNYWNLGYKYYFNPPRVEVIFDAIQPDLKLFHANKIVCMFTESGMSPFSPQNFMMLSYYVANHLMVDLDADAEKLADQFLTGYYGPAAPTMKSWFTRIREGMKKYPQPKASSMSVGHWMYLTPEFMFEMYQDLHKAEKALPKDSRYAARVRYELITPIWYTLANWHNYGKIFLKAGLTKEALIKECRTLAREFIRRYPSKRPEKMDETFEQLFESATVTFARPEKFKNVPDRDYRLMTARNFRGVSILGSKKVKDPESIQGEAIKSADKRNEYHGVNILLPGKHGFRSTEFRFNGHPSTVHTYLQQVYQDEKYHWYRLPGSVVVSDKNTFWGHGWSIQGRANHWYTLTNGDPKDNTWDQIWISAKFTGPAYVKGSTRENAIYVDMVVGVRNQPDPDFQPVKNYTLDDRKQWKKFGSCQVKWTTEDGRNTLELAAGKNGRFSGPSAPCGPDDVVIVRVRARGAAAKVGCYLYDANDKKVGQQASATLDTGLQNEFVFALPRIKKRGDVAKFRVVLAAPAKGKTVYDQLEVKIAPKLNLPKEK